VKILVGKWNKKKEEAEGNNEASSVTRVTASVCLQCGHSDDDDS